MNVLITGGGGGLGKLISEHLYNCGYKIIVIDKIPLEKIDKIYLEKVDYFQVDLSDFDLLEKTTLSLIEIYKSIDVLINNAAVRNFALFQDFSNADIEKTVKINFHSPIFLIKLILPQMINNNFGRIINISSISALTGYSTGSLYCSTKAGLYIFTESLANDLKKSGLNITANSILPDSFQTREGLQLKSYEFITSSIIKVIDEFISSKTTGKTKIISPTKNKFIAILRVIYNHIKKFL